MLEMGVMVLALICLEVMALCYQGDQANHQKQPKYILLLNNIKPMATIIFAWLTENSESLCAQYAGKWVAVHDGKVVGVGETATEAAQQAREQIGDKKFILEAIPDEADVIYGGFPLAPANY